MHPIPENCIVRQIIKIIFQGKKGRKRRGKIKDKTQVPLFQMAPTAIPQRANTNFG